jgi:L-fuconate dehydratase
MPMTITRITAHDVRFPTSRHLDGSDAMNQAPDYSAAYALLETDGGNGPVGHGMTFTIGRGNEICAHAIESLAPLVVGRTLVDITADMGAFWRSVAGESDPSGHGGHRQRCMGPVGQDRGQAGLEAPGRHDARGAGPLH